MDCHIIMDCTRGELLGEYVLKNQQIDKEQFFSWIIMLAKELEAVEKSSGIVEYRFLTPFSVVVKEDKTIALLNLRAKANQKRMDQLFEKQIMEKFLPASEEYSDIYSFGKTLQYLFSKADLYPDMSKVEEKKFLNIISRCTCENSKRRYSNFEEIISDLSNSKKKNVLKNIILFIIIIIVVIAGILKMFLVQQESMTDEEAKAYLDTGITYFVTMKDYKKSEELFSKIHNIEIAEYYQEMAAFMTGESDKTEEEIEVILKQFEDKAGQELDYEEKYCLLKVYSELNSETAKEKVIELGEDILESADWKRNESEIREIVEIAKKS